MECRSWTTRSRWRAQSANGRRSTFAGIAFYPGHVREPVDQQTLKLEQLQTTIRDAIAAFDRAGLHPPVVSGGSTPTLWRTHELEGVTEFRPGTYVYNDRTTAAIGACEWDDCALTVLATVVSTAVPGQAVIDAGTKALGREPMRGTDTVDGFGCVLGHPDVIVKSMSEEHGMLDLTKSSWRPSVGDRVRIIPNHVCIVVHLNDVIAGVRGDVVETSWPVAARGRGYVLPALSSTNGGAGRRRRDGERGNAQHHEAKRVDERDVDRTAHVDTLRRRERRDGLQFRPGHFG